MVCFSKFLTFYSPDAHYRLSVTGMLYAATARGSVPEWSDGPEWNARTARPYSRTRGALQT
jgi:hypothetical protein